MKTAMKITRMVLVTIIGLLLVTCQKEDSVLPVPAGETQIGSPGLKISFDPLYVQCIDLTIDKIKDLVDEGTLNKGNGNALIVKLNAARQNLLKNKFDTVIGILEAFKNLVDDFVIEGKISLETGEDLVKGPNAVIQVFTHQCGDPYWDWRDGHWYNTLQMGGRCWFSENLNYETDYSFYYDNEPGNEETYGRLYFFGATSGACPMGWHLPSYDEWTLLTDYLIENRYGFEESGDDIGKSMASASGWTVMPIPGNVGNDQETNNSSGFNAPPGGRWSEYGFFDKMGDRCFFWSSTPSPYGIGWDIWFFYLDYCQPYLMRGSSSRTYGYSVRCVKKN